MFPKPVLAKGDRRRLGLPSQCLLQVVGSPPNHRCSPTPTPPAFQVGVSPP